MPKEAYKPTPEDYRKAEEIMSEEDGEKSQKREKILEMLKTSSGGAYAIEGARELGVPEQEIKEYALRVVEADMWDGYLPSVSIRMAENTGIASREEVEEVVRKTYKQILEENPFNVSIAEYLYGRDSEEYQRAKELYKTEKAPSAETEIIPLSSDATFFDLFTFIDPSEADLGDVFWNNVNNNFLEEISGELRKIFDNPESARQIKVLEFFEERGYTKDDLELFLLIRFR